MYWSGSKKKVRCFFRKHVQIINKSEGGREGGREGGKGRTTESRAFHSSHVKRASLFLHNQGIAYFPFDVLGEDEGGREEGRAGGREGRRDVPPNPGPFIAATLREPRSLFMTRASRASPLMSSAIIRSCRSELANCSRSVTISRRLEMTWLVTKT